VEGSEDREKVDLASELREAVDRFMNSISEWIEPLSSDEKAREEFLWEVPSSEKATWRARVDSTSSALSGNTGTMSADSKPTRSIWILLRAAGATRKFLRVSISSTDGSVYLALGDPHRNVRIAQGSITIPAGETSASVDYTKHIVATFENFQGAHLGLKASGRVIEKFGDRYYPLGLNVPPSVPRDTLLQTIYPAPLGILPVSKPRPQDIVLPDQFEYRARSFAL